MEAVVDQIMSLESEVAVLGCMFRYTGVATKLIQGLTVDMFSKDEHKLIFEVSAELCGRGIPTEAATVAEELKRRGLLKEIPDGVNLFVDLLEHSCLEASIDYYIELLQEKHKNRQIVKYSELVQDIIEADGSFQEKLDTLKSSLIAIENNHRKSNSCKLSDILPEAEKALSTNNDSLKTGFKSIDYMIGGLPVGITVLGARPSMGKTALAICIALRMAKAGKRVVVFTLETTPTKLAERLLCSEARVDGMKLKRNESNPDDFVDIELAKHQLNDLEIYFIDSYRLTPMGIMPVINTFKPDCVIIDFLQLMKSSTANKQYSRNDEVGTISRELKIVACETGIPFIVLSQLNRLAEYRSDSRPKMSDLRDSGSIEQDADVIMLLYREDQQRKNDPQYTPQNEAETTIAKNKDGKTGSIKLMFHPEYVTFENLDQGGNFK